jgi:hypothetical protein
MRLVMEAKNLATTVGLVVGLLAKPGRDKDSGHTVTLIVFGAGSRHGVLGPR